MDGRSPDMDPIIKPTESPSVKSKPDSAGEMLPAASREKPPAPGQDNTLIETPLSLNNEADTERIRAGLRPADNDATFYEDQSLDPDATIHEEITNPETGAARQITKEGLGRILTDLARGETPRSDFYVDLDHQRIKKPRTILQKTGEVISKAAREARMAATMAAQFGGIHPWLIDGKWRWVIEPWARFEIDPHQHEWDRGMNSSLLDRFWELKAEGVKTISAKHLANYNGVPKIMLILPLGLQYVNQHRIQAAQAAGLRIEVDILRGYDTFN